MHYGFPFSHASDFDGVKIKVRAVVSGFSHEDDMYCRGDGRDLVELENFEHLTNQGWLPLVIDTTDYNLGNLTYGSITKIKRITKLDLIVGTKIEFYCFVSVKNENGYSYHGNRYWYKHPYLVRPSKVQITEYNVEKTIAILEKYDNDLIDYMDEKFA